MSEQRGGTSGTSGTRSSTVLQRLEDLEVALAAGGDRLDRDAVKKARELIARTGERLRLGAERTVVSLVGATGSGKSSLFNALAGMELAEAGVRRPTTGQAGACVWAAQGADPLLDWLGVPRRQRTNRESVLDGTNQQDLHGLVLLDLPDHDSTQVAHRLEVERLVELVDLLVWVVDPQKYADEALHAYLRGLRGHAGVMLVVLNHVDTLDAEEARTCAGDLRRLLDADGLGSVSILTTSARTGAGVKELRGLLAELVARRGAFEGRALADIEATAAELRPGLAATEADPTRLPGSDQLLAALAEAAGLPVVLEAVTADYRRRCVDGVDWVVRRWWQRLRRDPLRRLGLSEDDEAQVRRLTQAEVPAATPAQRERVELAVRDVTEACADGLPEPWSQAVHAAVVADTAELSDAIDAAVRSVDTTMHPPSWWRGLSVLQTLLVASSLVGLVWWVLTLAGVSSPRIGGVSLASLLLLDGLGLSAVVALGGRWLALTGAGRRRSRIAAQLRTAVSAVAVERVVAPIAAVLIDHRSTRQALEGSR
jgi:GTP-binding protein EngB required for normal cell division